MDVICDADAVDGVRDALGVDPISEETAECLRIEAGRPGSAATWATTTIPQEAGAERARGQLHEGLLRRPGDRRPAALQGQAQPPPAGAAPHGPPRTATRSSSASKEVGTVGSACVSPTLGPIALALVRREAEPGDTVTVGEAGDDAELVELPFKR